MADENNTGLSITLKAGTGYGAPWVVLHAQSVFEAGEMLEELRLSGALTAVREAAREFQAATPSMEQAVQTVQRTFPGAQTHQPGQVWAGGSQAQQGGSQELPSQYQPGGNAPQCAHGAMKYIANGKFGPFWACPTPMGAQDKCKSRNAN